MNAISSITQKPATPTTVERSTRSAERATTAAPATSGGKTTVTISSAARAAAAQEAAETPQQTAQEARGNDRQAQRLIARQAQAHPTTA